MGCKIKGVEDRERLGGAVELRCYLRAFESF